VGPVNPSPRSSAQGFAYKHFFFVHGGEFVSQSQSQFLHFRDLWRFDTKLFQWEEMKACAKGGPSARSGHRVVVWRKKDAVLFGGFYDNALECKYYNDLWVLSDLDAGGAWLRIPPSPNGDIPHVRSGHACGVFNDQFFVYGGYSTEKFNRFKKSEATVHHDLWMVNLSVAVAGGCAQWNKLRLGGVPPPIRSGVGFAAKEKKLYLFGGVVDIETPGGRMSSKFHNDLFCFHMDTQRFYPVVLKTPSRSHGHGADRTSRRERAGANTLEGELAALRGAPEDDDSDNSEESDDGLECASAPVDGPAGQRLSYQTNRHGQVTPFPRMDAGMCIVGHTLYLFGGQFESENRETSLSDLFSLNLNVLGTFEVLHAQNLDAVPWKGREESEGEGSWESGSTVVSALMCGDAGELDSEDERQLAEADAEERERRGAQQGCLDPQSDDVPCVVPLDDELTAFPSTSVDGRTMVRGKRGMKVHKEQLLAQLGASASVPTPLNPTEGFRDFFARTQNFWMSMAAECLFEENLVDNLSDKQRRKCTTEGRRYAAQRHREAVELMEQLRLVEEREKEEAEFFRRLREAKEKAGKEDCEDCEGSTETTEEDVN
jgi:hypothetical protein